MWIHNNGSSTFTSHTVDNVLLIGISCAAKYNNNHNYNVKGSSKFRRDKGLYLQPQGIQKTASK